MKALREAAGQDLQWRGKKVGLVGKEEFELRSGDEVLAMLHAREKRTDWTCGEAADGEAVLLPVQAPSPPGEYPDSTHACVHFACADSTLMRTPVREHSQGSALNGSAWGTSLQTILDLLGVRGRPFSDPHASTSNHDVACTRLSAGGSR